MVTYVLKPRPPRVIGLAAILVLIGAVLAGIALAKGGALLWVGAAVVGGLGVCFVLLGLSALRRNRIFIELDDDGYVIWGPDGERTGAWSDVTRVSLSRRRDKLALYHGERRRTVIAHPAGFADDEFLRLRHDIEAHLVPVH
jgi:hypothetical protein